MGLSGTKVLLIGYGRIGRRVGELLHAFDAELLILDPFLDQGGLLSGERLVTLDEGLAEAEVISLHASGQDCLLDAAAFSKMRAGVLILNSARGELVSEDALVQALDSGKVGGAWFDAFWKEPYEGPLTQYDQVLLTPHVGTYTKQCRLGMESQAVKNLLRDLGPRG
jgi:D-3-phosphoglycerate dehydrogenase